MFNGHDWKINGFTKFEELSALKHKVVSFALNLINVLISCWEHELKKRKWSNLICILN